MKHFLQAFYALTVMVLISAFGIPTQLHAQSCSISNVSVKLNSSGTSGSNCMVNVDLSWDQMNNNGNKFVNVHLWTQSAYLSLSYANAPNATDLQNALGTIVIATSSTPALSGTYQPAPGTAMLAATSVQRVVVSGNLYRFTVKGISLTLPGACSGAATIRGDIWASNNPNSSGVNCFNAGSSFVANDPTVTGLMRCNNPRDFKVDLTTQSATPLQATYTVYADEAPLGTLDESDDLIFTSGSVTIPAAGTYSSGFTTISNTYSGLNLWVKVQVTGQSFSTLGIITNTCSVLPVKLASFSANRTTSSAVSIQWQTATEQNNKGFEILRKDGNGSFKSVASVSSKSKTGSSDVALDYQYTDANNSADQTQYRLLQTDFDGKLTYSPIAVVRGQESGGMSVLSSNGNTVLAFSNITKKDISIIDLSGRLVKSASSFAAGNYTINGIKAGVYFIRVREVESGKTMTAKVVLR